MLPWYSIRNVAVTLLFSASWEILLHKLKFLRTFVVFLAVSETLVCLGCQSVMIFSHGPTWGLTIIMYVLAYTRNR